MKLIKINLILILLLICGIFPFHGASSLDTDVVSISSISIDGEVIDNYANISYMLAVNAADFDDSLEFNFQIPDNLYLSNVSIISENQVYWAQVLEQTQAQQEYDDAVEDNQTATLIKSLGNNNYYLSANIKQNIDVEITIFLEGILLRYKSQYSLNFVSIDLSSQIQTILDLDVKSTSSNFRKIKLSGITGVTTSQITNGYNIAFNQVLPTKLTSSITYELDYNSISNLKTYTDGINNYFVYQLAPEIYSSEEQMPKSYVFVIDTSGSMMGDRITNAKEAFNSIINTLTNQDYFNVIQFNSGSYPLWSELKIADSTNLEYAKNWVNGLSASGGTNINDALLDAIASLQEDNNRAKSITFLSDGDPSSGVRDKSSILRNINEANNIDVPIFSISLGTEIDEELMKNIASQSHANYVKIGSSSNIVAELLDFYKGFSTPVTTGMELSFSNAIDVAPKDIPISALFNGTELLVTGKFTDDMTVSTILEYSNSNQTITNNVVMENVNTENSHIEFLWAIYSIQALYNQYSADKDLYFELRNSILDLALKYGIVVEGITAMILVVNSVEDVDYNAGDSVDNVDAPPVNNVFETLNGSVDFTIFFVVLSLIPLLLIRKNTQDRD